MFEGIHSYGGEAGLCGASYTSGEVHGHVSFSASPDRTSVMSSIGPDDAVLKCSFSHYYSSILRRQKARVVAEVDSLV